MNIDDRSAEEIYLILVPKTQIEPVKGAAVVGPVADTNQPLAAELQLLPANIQICRLVVEFDITLTQIEFVAHVGGDDVSGKAERMGVVKLQVCGDVLCGTRLDTAVHARELIHPAIAGDEVIGCLSLGAPAQLKVQRRPLGHCIPLQLLYPTLLL